MANRQNFRLTAGEDRTLTLTATNSDGSAMDLTGASINWTVARLKGNAPSLVKTGTVLSAANGTFTVSVSAGDTQLMRAATYFHQAMVTIGGSSKNGVEGSLVLTAENQSILAASAGAVFNNNQFYGTRAEGILTKLGTNASFIETFGYYSVGDGGGGFYKRVGAAPSINEYFQSADGAYWELFSPDGRLNVKQYGAKGDGATADTTAIQKAINYAHSMGGGVVYFPAATYVSGALTLYSFCRLQGESVATTEIKCASGTNATLITSYNFASLTGQNKWLASDGVLVWAGLADIRLNGNKSAQSAGNGLSIYGKGLYIDRVVIYDTYAKGVYSETGDTAGQTDWTDLPEGSVSSLWIRNSGDIGWHMRGPHDCFIDQLQINASGSDGMRIEYSAGTYNGICDITFAHIYANTGYGVNSNAAFKASHLISESNFKEGLYLDGSHAHISMLEMYNNCRTSGSYELVIPSTASKHTIASANIRNFSSSSINGVQVAGDHCSILGGIVTGTLNAGGASAAIGIEYMSGADFNDVSLDIDGFSGNGGIGLKTNSGGTMSYNRLTHHITNCKTLWNNASDGVGNVYELRGLGSSGQTVFSGNGPRIFANNNEDWHCYFQDSGGTQYRSKVRRISGASVDLTDTGYKTFTVGHQLLATPSPEDCMVQFVYTGADTTWRWDVPPFVSAVSSTLVSISFKIGTAAGAGQTGNLIVWAEL